MQCEHPRFSTARGRFRTLCGTRSDLNVSRWISSLEAYSRLIVLIVRQYMSFKHHHRSNYPHNNKRQRRSLLESSGTGSTGILCGELAIVAEPVPQSSGSTDDDCKLREHHLVRCASARSSSGQISAASRTTTHPLCESSPDVGQAAVGVAACSVLSSHSHHQ